jgi:CBS domain containing-hemolysin-like protein
MEIDVPETDSVTLGGVMQEVLQKLCEKGDQCIWGPFNLKVIDTDTPSGLLVELHFDPGLEDES